MALPFSKEIAGDETENQATEVSLPRYEGEEREYDETPYDSYPEGDRGGYWEDKHPYSGSHHSKGSTQGEDSSRGADSYGERWTQKYEQNITQYAAAKVSD